ncbi:MAG: choice-of-anchor J domain-containing protein [Pseudobacter sp.]|uniref:choice-of-anchor J domain-containing protein n=1 Tax=Pseudobacter sp. TaxID=2045420 RepID=UPI003F7EF706
MKNFTRILAVLLLLVTTGKLRAQVVFYESFDNISGPTSGGPGTYTFPAGWLLRNTDNRTLNSSALSYPVNNAWIRRENFKDNVNDSCAMSCSWYSPAGAANDWMWTPAITIPSGMQLSWRARSMDASNLESYEVRIMSGPTAPTGGTGSIGNQITNSTVLYSTTSETATWTKRTVPLTAYSGQTVYIGFRNNSNGRFILMVDDVKVAPPEPLSASIKTQNNVSCNGGSNGYVTVEATGGVMPYTYQWAHGVNNSTALGLPAGKYTVTVTDNAGATTTVEADITEPAALTASIDATQMACNGTPTGSATVTVSGGTAPYYYAWSPLGGIAATATGLAPNTYTVDYYDNHGCMGSKQVTITAVSSPVITGITVPDNGTYSSGKLLTFVVQFDKAVTVSNGAPSIALNLESGNKALTYTSGSGTTELSFTYTVTGTDLDINGIGIANSISLNGSNIRNGGCNAANTFTVPDLSNIIIQHAQPQTLSFAQPDPVTYGEEDFALNASTNSLLPLTITSSNHDVATIVDGKIHITGAGSTTITVSQAGNDEWLPHTGIQHTLIVNKAAQVITWTQTLQAGCNGSSTISLAATSNSGLDITYESSNTGIASINNNTLTVHTPGSATITASQPGSDNYLPATSVQLPLTAALPSTFIVKRWSDLLIFDNSSEQYKAWQWYRNGDIIPGATQQFYQTTQPSGNYHVVATTVGGQTLQTCAYTFTSTVVNKLRIYPNPVKAGQQITVVADYTEQELQGAKLVVTTLQGTTFHTLLNVKTLNTITMPNQGLYVMRLVFANGTSAAVTAMVKE